MSQKCHGNLFLASTSEQKRRIGVTRPVQFDQNWYLMIGWRRRRIFGQVMKEENVTTIQKTNVNTQKQNIAGQDLPRNLALHTVQQKQTVNLHCNLLNF